MRLLRAAAAAGIFAAALLQIVRSHERLHDEVIEALAAEPCDDQWRHRRFIAAFAGRVKARYDLPNPSCTTPQRDAAVPITGRDLRNQS
jgi:hypothetical protein